MNKIERVLWVGLFVVILLAVIVLYGHADTYSSQPDGSSGVDAYINAGVPDTNIGSSTVIGVGEYNADTTSTTRGLVKFDISSVPSNAIVSSATLTLWVQADYSDNARTMRVYRLKRNWSEGGATWNKYDGTNSWQTAGGGGANDIDTAAMGSVSLSASEASGTQIDISLTVSEVQSFVNGTYTNYGWLLKMDTELNDEYTFYSSDEGTQTTKRPKLTIVWALPTSTPTNTSVATATPTRTNTPGPTSVYTATPTPPSLLDSECTGIPAGYGTVTPDASWLALCGQCLPTPTLMWQGDNPIPSVNTDQSISLSITSAELVGHYCNGLTCNINVVGAGVGSYTVHFSFTGLELGSYSVKWNSFNRPENDLVDMGTVIADSDTETWDVTFTISQADYQGGSFVNAGIVLFEKIAGDYVSPEYPTTYDEMGTIIFDKYHWYDGYYTAQSGLAVTGGGSYGYSMNVVHYRITGWIEDETVLDQIDGFYVYDSNNNLVCTATGLVISDCVFSAPNIISQTYYYYLDLKPGEQISQDVYVHEAIIHYDGSACRDGGDWDLWYQGVSILSGNAGAPSVDCQGDDPNLFIVWDLQPNVDQNAAFCSFIDNGERTYQESYNYLSSVILVDRASMTCDITVPAFDARDLLAIIPDWLFDTLPSGLQDFIDAAVFPGLEICFIPVDIPERTFYDWNISISLLAAITLAAFVVYHFVNK